MKTIIIVRHSKAEQNFLGTDFERKLTETGKENTLLVANKFKERGLPVDLIISSPAKRAKTTAQLFSDVIGYHKDAILYKSELYNAPEFVYSALISQISDDVQTVVLFGHNPGITNFINSLGLVHIDNVPTTGIFAFSLPGAQWKNFLSSKKTFLFFDYPKLNK